MGVYVGIDMSKQHLDWVLGEEGNVERASNSPAGVRQLVARLSKIEIASIIVESTGGYERALTEALTAADLPVILVNPWRVRRFGEGLGVLAKTDPLDARMLAHLVSLLVRREGRCRAPNSVRWPISSDAVANSSP